MFDLVEDGITYRVHVFETPGEIDFKVLARIDDAELLLVAGGGGGGGGGAESDVGQVAGGGGAGGVRVASKSLEPGSYRLQVGTGGTGGTGRNSGTNGEDTHGFGLSAIGGGGGGHDFGNGLRGGSGGGGGRRGTGGQPALEQGHPGGRMHQADFIFQQHVGGGGGGAGSPGHEGAANRNAPDRGAGGAGLLTRITGRDFRLAGGGGGGSSQPDYQASGADGGGAGAAFLEGTPVPAEAGAAGSGGGGGGGAMQLEAGGAGGSGRIMLRYAIAADTPLPLALADRETGSIDFTNTGEVDVVHFPVPDGVDRYQITHSGDLESLKPDQWRSVENVPATLRFDPSDTDQVMTFYVWFDSGDETLARRMALGRITHTRKPPEVQNLGTLTLQTAGFSVRVSPDDLDTGSTGGKALDRSIDIAQRRVVLMDGPGNDATPDDAFVTLAEPGDYTLALEVVNAAGTTARASRPCRLTLVEADAPPGDADRYVALGNLYAQPPYQSWRTAAATLQDAVNAAAQGETLRVWAGRYTTCEASRVDDSGTRNVLLADKPLTVKSVFGPERTILDGQGHSRPLSLRFSRRDAWMVLDGFTLTNGYALRGGAVFRDHETSGGRYMALKLLNCHVLDNVAENHGGAIFTSTGNQAARAPLVISNCVIKANQALAGHGGALYHQTFSALILMDTTLKQNTASGNGGAILHDSNNRPTLIENSRFADNRARRGHGGAISTSRTSMTMRNSLLHHNEAARGGAIFVHRKPRMTLENCTLTENRARSGGSAGGLELHRGPVSGDYVALRNVILWNNQGGNGNLAPGPYLEKVSVDNSRFSADDEALGFAGANNLTDDPLFIDAESRNYRLQPDSPCIDAGLNAPWMEDALDLDGHPRINPERGRVDMGAYER